MPARPTPVLAAGEGGAPPRRSNLVRWPKGIRPPGIGGRQLRTADRIGQLAAEVLGTERGRAVQAALSPHSRLDRQTLRRVLDCVLPKQRPVPLAIGPIETARDYDQASALILAATASGQITPAEAQAWQGIVAQRWDAVLAVKAAAGL